MPPPLAKLIPTRLTIQLQQLDGGPSYYLDALERRLADRMERLRRLSAVRIAVYAALARTGTRR